MPTTAPVVITSCTSRKRGVTKSLSPERWEQCTSLDDMARSWLGQVRAAHPTHTVSSLYGGRGFAESIKASQRIDARLHVVSAGLGLVHGDDPVPAYDVTAAGATGALQEALRRLNAPASSWWRAINGGSALARLIASVQPAPVLMALPASYIDMLADDLAEVRVGDITRLRIFTSGAGAECLPAELLPAVMPYDDRLEAVPGWSGTRSDFPQRALGHFVAELHGHELSQADASAAVARVLKGLKAPDRTAGSRLDDIALRRWIATHWSACGGSTSRLLAYLRGTAGLACEQSRFARLCREVRTLNEERAHAVA